MTASIYSDKKPIGKIYLTTNTVNGMQYVGQTVRLNDTWYKGSGILLKEAFSEFGKNNFIIEVLEYVYCRSQLDPLEMKWIEAKNTLHPFGYNKSKGGGHREVTEEGRRNYSKSKIGNLNPQYGGGEKNPMFGLKGDKHPAYGRKRGVEELRKFSEKVSGENHWNYGRCVPSDVRMKISVGWKSRKPVTCPYCGKEGTQNMKRYHFDNCKKKV